MDQQTAVCPFVCLSSFLSLSKEIVKKCATPQLLVWSQSRAPVTSANIFVIPEGASGPLEATISPSPQPPATVDLSASVGLSTLGISRKWNDR